MANHPACSGPECAREGLLRDPRKGDPVCTAHYQQASRHPDHPLRALRRKRTRRESFFCSCCGQQKNHFAKNLCKACYEWTREHGCGRRRRLRA